VDLFLQQVFNGLIIGSNYGLIAIGLTIIFGVLNIVNLAHGEVYMLGAFTAYLTLRFVINNFFVALFVTVVVTAIIGVIIERLVFRPIRKQEQADINYFIVSMGLLVFLESLAILIWGPGPRSMGASSSIVHLGPVILTTQRIYTALTAISVILFFHFFIKYSKMGKAMRAAEQDPEGALSVGIGINEISSITFAIGSALAGIAGALMGSLFIVEPMMGFNPLIKAFIIVVIGGLGSIMGAIAGGLILGFSEVFSGVYLSSMYKEAFGFLLLIIILTVRPEGLFPTR
jgi:branched-chain amino acid transport system permease protein